MAQQIFDIGNSTIANKPLYASDFNAFLQRMGQDCLWLRSMPVIAAAAHDKLGQSMNGMRQDGREHDWAKYSSWQPVSLRQLAPGIYRSEQPLYAVQRGQISTHCDSIVSLSSRERSLIVQARTKLQHSYAISITALEADKLKLPDDLRSHSAVLGSFRNINLTDSQGTAITTQGIGANLLHAIGILPGHTYFLNFDYYPPVKLSILSQNLHKHMPWVLDQEGEAGMSFPDWLPIAQGDIVILLAATHIEEHKFIVGGDTLELPTRWAAGIEYLEGHDTLPVLLRGGKLWWPANPPSSGTPIVLRYRVYNQYRVLREQPSSRSQENQAHPRQVALQLVTHDQV